MRTIWPEVRSKFLFQQVRRPCKDTDGTVTAFRDGQVVLRSERREDGFTEAVQFIGYQGVIVGDLVIHSMDGFAGAIGISESNGKMSPVAHIYAPKRDLDLRFYAYYLRHLANAGYIQSLAKGIRERSTSFDPAIFSEISLPVPPIEEQRRIADYLDAQIERIDSIVHQRKNQMELNKSLITSRLAELVSPEFGLTPLKRLAHVSVSNVDKHSIEEDLPVSLCNYVDVYKNRVISDEIDFMRSTASREQVKRFSLQAGDVLFTKDSETADDIAQCALVTQTIPDLVLGYHCGLLRSFAVSSEYLYWAMQSPYVANQFTLSATGVTRVGLKLADIGIVLIPTPTQKMQEKVVSTLKEFVIGTEKLNQLAQAQVDSLIRMKSSLISSAVTGEFDVFTGRSVA